MNTPDAFKPEANNFLQTEMHVSTDLVIITPSIEKDLELVASLNRSIGKYCTANFWHHIIVPDRQLDSFRHLQSATTSIHPESEFLPRSFRQLPFVNFHINLVRPLPPVRGWMLQQIIKLAAAARLATGTVLLIDSDIEFVRSFSRSDFEAADGSLLLHKRANSIDSKYPRHLLWHATARRILGLMREDPPHDNYINSLMVWDSTTVRELTNQLQRGRLWRWQDIVASRVHFSEWITYGVYVDNFLESRRVLHTNREWCHNYWTPVPLTPSTALEFAASLPLESLAMMISAKSRTSRAVRELAYRRAAVVATDSVD